MTPGGAVGPGGSAATLRDAELADIRAVAPPDLRGPGWRDWHVPPPRPTRLVRVTVERPGGRGADSGDRIMTFPSG